MKQRLTGMILPHYGHLYCKGNRKVKGDILDKLSREFGYHRKALARLLRRNGKWARRLRKPSIGSVGRPKRYDTDELIRVLNAIWLATDQMCSKKLKPALALWLPSYEQEYGVVTPETKALLLTMSSASIDRYLKPYRAKMKKRGRCGTRPGSLLKNQIPIKTNHWDVNQPGFVEADTVAHCGNSIEGNFVWSLTLSDIHTGWTEIRATWNKGSAGVLEQIQDIERCLPFDLQGFDCDNGSEFLNHHLFRYFTERTNVIQFTRSRPYRKNDNAHVEQKNWTHVRQLMGYDRFDNPQLVALMNDLYSHEWSLLQNYFHPNMKLLSKEKINSKYRKRYDTPKTAYQRIMVSEHIDEATKAKHKTIFLSLNPFELNRQLENKLTAIINLTTKIPKQRVSI